MMMVVMMVVLMMIISIVVVIMVILEAIRRNICATRSCVQFVHVATRLLLLLPGYCSVK